VMATTVSGTESSFGISGAGGRSSSKVNLIQDNTESKVITQVENEVSAELRKVHDVDIIELELPRIKAEGKK
ncbi:12913_t:CDS:2, partial [Cetraspora pellucida]